MMQRMKHMQLDPELIAMNRVSEELKYLNQGQRIRVIDWAKARFNLIVEKPVEVPAAVGIPAPGETPAAISTEPTTPTVPTEPEVEPAARVSEPEETATKPTTVKTKQAAGKIFTEFETIDDLFLRANAKKVSHRILLVAAYLQEKGNLHELASLDINSQLKELGYGVPNITTLINGLLKKKPPQIIVTRKEGDTKQSRRKFKVTEKGFKDAQSFITPTDNIEGD
ncbi:MAG: hypothetical protein NT166_25870 [Candidatus Aminicenantes bacterium]|nr:hypothetical protein [Candidatus Aminicenantes bacterium]